VLETPHVIIGATLALKIGNPLLALPLAFGSHFVLDKVPHWNPHLNTEIAKLGRVSDKSKAIIAVDIILSLISGLLIASFALPNVNLFLVVLAGGLLGVLPDLVEGPYFFLGVKTKLITRWIKFQKSTQVDTSPLPGLLTQFVTIVAAFWWILK